MASRNGRGKRHAHKEKRRETYGFTRYMAYTLCGTCDKQCYLTREEARRSAKVNHPGLTMHAYRCEEEESGRTYWHLSSIPAGKLTRLKNRNAPGEASGK